MEKSKPVLVIMAAGMGSRYGSLKQIATVDDDNHIIMDYSIYDAYRAGFREVVCVINPKQRDYFDEHFNGKHPDIHIRYAYQELANLPPGFVIPPGREKPWGTAHAILCAKPLVGGPFAVINADDFYGPGAYKIVYDFLQNKATDTHHALVGYRIENTLSETGGVARGVCEEKDGLLVKITETFDIKPASGGASYPSGGEQVFLPGGTLVSMNMFGFGRVFLDELENRFAAYLNENLHKNPMKCEFLLPAVVGDMLEEKVITVEILPSVDKWYGVTFAEDMPAVQAAIADKKKNGEYPNI
jgi:choline kinase